MKKLGFSELRGARRFEDSKNSVQRYDEGSELSPVSSPVEIRTLTTPQELFAVAAEEVVHAAKEAVEARGRFTIALSGGSTPRSMFNLLATNARTSLPWDRMFFFWGDERHVPPTDVDSNYRMADEAMLSKVPVPAGNVFRIPTENPDGLEGNRAVAKLLGKLDYGRRII